MILVLSVFLAQKYFTVNQQHWAHCVLMVTCRPCEDVKKWVGRTLTIDKSLPSPFRVFYDIGRFK